MVCIYCGSKTKVNNSRGSGAGDKIWRRRECLHCGGIFTTHESADYSGALRVQPASGALQPFERDKLFMSLHNSLAHRKSAVRDASGLCQTVMQLLLHEHNNGLLTATAVATCTHDVLQRFDPVAASVYAARHGVH